MKNRLKAFLFALVILSAFTIAVPTVAAQQDILIYDNNEIQPRTDIKEWVYKVENGNLYKRLYNYSTARWETDWIFVMSGVTEY